MKKVLIFGTFDPIHAGHEYVFAEAKKLGDYVIVVVAQDEAIRREKHREPHMPQQDRLRAVSEIAGINETLLGDESPKAYELLKNLIFDVLVLGYDQLPSDDDVRAILNNIGKEHVRVVRLSAYKPDQYKSSLMRTS